MVVNMTISLALLFRCGQPHPLQIMTRTDCPITWDIIRPVLYVNASLYALSDWTAATAPAILLLQARHLDARSRKGAWFLIVLAMAASIVSVTRLGFIDDWTIGPTIWHTGVRLAVLSYCELALAITALSLATLQPLLVPLRRLLTRITSRGPRAPCYNDMQEKRIWHENPQSTAASGDSATRNTTRPSSFELLDIDLLRGVGILPDPVPDAEDDLSWTVVVRVDGYGFGPSNKTASSGLSTMGGTPLVSILELSEDEEEDGDLESGKKGRTT